MARVFPEEMDRLDLNDTRGSLRVLEDYVRYITERVEFSTANTKRIASDGSITDVAVLEILSDLSNTMSSLTSTVNSMRAELSSLQERVSALEG